MRSKKEWFEALGLSPTPGAAFSKELLLPAFLMPRKENTVDIMCTLSSEELAR